MKAFLVRISLIRWHKSSVGSNWSSLVLRLDQSLPTEDLCHLIKLIGSNWSSLVLVFMSFLIPALFCPFYRSSPTLKWVFQKLFRKFFVLLGGFLNQLPNRRQKCSLLATRQSLLLTFKRDFTLWTNVFIASDKIVSATHLKIRIALPMNRFIASDECVFCLGRVVLTLEANGSDYGKLCSNSNPQHHCGEGLLPFWCEPACQTFLICNVFLVQGSVSWAD